MRCIAVLMLVAGCGRLSFGGVADVVDGGSDSAPLTYPQTVLASEPFAYYRLEDLGGLATDSSGHGRDAPLVSNLDGAVTVGLPGAFNGSTAMRFSGNGIESNNSQAFIDTPDPLDDAAWASEFANPWTIEMFVKLTLKPPLNSYSLMICEDFNDNMPNMGVGNGFRTGFSTTPEFRFWNKDANGNTDVRSPMIEMGTWYHFAVVRTATDATMYVDGEMVDSELLPDYLPPAGPSANCGFGAFHGLPSRVELDEVAFYDHVLTAGEIATHFAVSGR